MSTGSEEEQSSNVQAQADFRLRFGIPVALAIVAILQFVSPGTLAQYQVVGIALFLYIAYAVAVRYMSQRAGAEDTRSLVLLTAVCDPIFLSVWLYAVGDASVLFVGLYTFTALGFGFRIGNWAMFLCQGVSICAFVGVVLTSPRWGTAGVSELSHLLVMVMVPLYAASLIRRLQSAKALAEYESQGKSMLLAKVSHELRTPLTGIVSAAQLIEMETADEAIRNRAQAIHEMATGLDGEIGRMLDLAKMDANVDHKDQVPFSVSEAAGNVMRTLLPVASVKGIDLRLDIDPRITCQVVGASKALDGVLVNLAGNAIKFTPTGAVTVGMALVEEKRSAYRIRFSVKDTGIGIAQADIPRIFEPFYQVDSGTTRQFGGTGLGTTIAMEAVKRLGGVLQIESELDSGTTFWFEIELAKSSETSARPEDAAPARIVTGKRVLVADDNRVNLELLRQMLVKDSHHVSTVTSGAQAIQLLASENFDLVLLDFNLGSIDGATVFQTYTFGRIDTAPTYFITADTTKATGVRLAEIGASGVIYKPVSFDRLRRAIASHFDETDAVSPVSLVASGKVAGEQSAVTTVGRTRPHLRAVPVEYLDPQALAHLRLVNDTPEFLFTMLSAGIEDIETSYERLTAAMRQGRLADVHHDAHALCGLSLNFGAVRLAAIAERLMSISEQDLAVECSRVLSDMGVKFTQSVNALREVREQNAPEIAESEASRAQQGKR